MKQTKKYIEVCKRLGFRPEVEFVEIHRNGSIGFTCGKPDEIRSLLSAVEREGMVPHPLLIARVESL